MMDDTVLHVASTFRDKYTVYELRALYVVTGRECGISGDLWLTNWPSRREG